MLVLQHVPFVVRIRLLIISHWHWMSKMNHNFIMDHNLSFKEPCELICGFEVMPPSFAGWSLNVIAFERSPLASFSSYFSLRFAKKPKTHFPINFGERASTSPYPSRMLHLSHLRRTLYHIWKIASVSKRIFMLLCWFYIQSRLECFFKFLQNISQPWQRLEIWLSKIQ
jgi:hypothetical protein